MEVVTLARPRTVRRVGPNLQVPDLVELLGFTEEWIRNLSNRPLSDPDRLPAYFLENGSWHMKTNPHLVARPLYYYEEDVQAWLTSHPLKGKQPHVDYTEEEAAQVLEAVYNGWYVDKQGNNYPLLSNGKVKRDALMRYLNKVHGNSKWRSTTYDKLKQILEDAGIPTPSPKSPHRRVYKRYAGKLKQKQLADEPRPNKKWVVKFYREDGTLREEVQHEGRLKPGRWARGKLSDKETATIEEVGNPESLVTISKDEQAEREEVIKVAREPRRSVERKPYVSQPWKVWLVKFYNPDGSLREEVRRHTREKPTAWAKKQVKEGETFTVEETEEAAIEEVK